MKIVPTPSGWLEAVMENFDGFLQDHASCEKKASGMALNIASHYPDRPDLLSAMADLAVEELSHYREVIRLLIQRGIKPGADQRDPYVRTLNDLIRQGSEAYLLDRLLVAAIVERRGSERFGLIADALASASSIRDDPALRDDSALRDGQTRPADGGRETLATFYRAITASESRHWALFVDLAEQNCQSEDVGARLGELLDAEAAIMLAQPFRAALH